MVVCKHCKKEFDAENKLKSHMGKCKIYLQYINEKLNEKFLKEMIEEKKFTMNHISIEILNGEFGVGLIKSQAKKFGIKTPSSKDSALNKNTRNKYKNTCLEKYGVEHALSKNTLSYKKRNQTVKDKYGVNNVFQLENVKSKAKETCLKKYGVENFVQTQEYKKYRNNGRISKPHKKISNLLTRWEIKHENDCPNKFFNFNENLNKEYNPIVDILIFDKNVVIEINGDIWHANPLFYKPNDIIYKWKGPTKSSDIWNFDYHRQKQIESFGYKVIVIWESDIKNNYKNVKEMLWKLLK